MLLFDLEANGLKNCTKIHVIVVYNYEKQEYTRYENNDVSKGVEVLQNADCIVGHNIINFDIPCIKKFYPWFEPKKVIDTLILSRVVYPDIRDIDALHRIKWNMPSKLVGSHSLEAWGYRLVEYKGDYGTTHSWENWSPEMSEYCEQDVKVTLKLYEKLLSKNLSQECLELEHEVATIIQKQIEHGFLFDVKKGEQLYLTLLRKREELTQRLQEVFQPWEVIDRVLIPKKSNKAKGYIAGVPVEIKKLITFNPSSRQHIAYQLQKRYNWKPIDFTDSGLPKIDESVLNKLNYPEAKLLSEYFLIEKRIGQLAEGDKAWLKMVSKDGRIHGDVITNGAVTGRMTHNNPNLAQVPAVQSDSKKGVLKGLEGLYGYECRELFTVPEGYKLVGCDAAALELRGLAHYMYPWDKGKYAEAAVNGNKKQGTDIHSINRDALGITSRDDAKTWFYAFIYGAGDPKLGSITEGVGLPSPMKSKSIFDPSYDPTERVKYTPESQAELERLGKIGKSFRSKFLKNLPALKSLTDRVKETVSERGYLLGIDGRHLHVRSSHSALNTLIQSAGAIIMKKALVLLYHSLVKFYKFGVDFAFVANIHDEFQIECKADIAEFVGQAAVQSIRDAASHFGFKCPLDGEFKIGNNWAETH